MTDLLRILRTEPCRPNWVDRMDAGGWYHWTRYESMLRRNPNWAPRQVESLGFETLRILRNLPDPNSARLFQGRGLVVGYVQSGKTANYTGLAARAADAGYRLFIVLSGIHDSLRNQTQNRLERELTGHQAGGVGRAEIGREWVGLTTPAEDFQEPDSRVLQGPSPFLIVAKKNVSVLRKLDRWMESAERYLATMPVLLIDDEADQASINTKGNRPPDAAIDDDEEETEDGENAPSATNALIRQILQRAPMAAYVAYTATPFANILINPNSVDRLVGTDLFPKDFVLQLPRPEGYTGTEELFGVDAGARAVLRPVPDSDSASLRLSSGRRRRSAEVSLGPQRVSLPGSLTDAILAFCLAGGIREIRSNNLGRALDAHTMLVHVSQKKAEQARIAEAIEVQLDLWRSALSQGQDLRPLFHSAWEDQRGGISAEADDTTIVSRAMGVLGSLEVLVLNSDTGEELEYAERPGRHIIAVGGNRLSRGLTLEGLTISYFLRTATMCDTLLQMARWYGFRRGYEDLIRIWTTDGIARWFGELALIEQSLRDSIQTLERAGRRPDQMAIRIRAHSELLLTARNKAVTATRHQDSWSGGHPQTVLFPLGDRERLLHNLRHTDAFLRRYQPRDAAHGGFLAHDVPPQAISEFLLGYQVHDETVAFRPQELANWIFERSQVGELESWTVFLASPEGGGSVDLGGRSVNLAERTRTSSESIGTLLDPRHEGVDLPDGPGAFRREAGTYDSEAMRRARPVTQGLLIIYPLDPRGLGVAPPVDAVIALALSLPHTTDLGSEWIINAGVVSG